MARPSGQRCEPNTQLLGRPKYLNDRPEGRSNLRPEGLAEKERRSLPTLARLSDRKASPPTPAHLRTASPTGRPGQTPLPTPTRVSDWGCAKPLLTALLQTGTIRADWDQSTGDIHSVRIRKRTEKVRQGTQVNRNTEVRTLYTCRTVPCNLPGMSEPKQCCGRRHFSYSVVGEGSRWRTRGGGE